MKGNWHETNKARKKPCNGLSIFLTNSPTEQEITKKPSSYGRHFFLLPVQVQLLSSARTGEVFKWSLFRCSRSTLCLVLSENI